jgi:hypothetical protein
MRSLLTWTRKSYDCRMDQCVCLSNLPLDHVSRESAGLSLALNGQVGSSPSGKSNPIRMRRKSSRKTGLVSNDTATSKPSTPASSNESMLFAEGTLASRSPLPDNAEEIPTLDISGPICGESFATYDHASRSWKTYQATFQWDSDEYSETWPKSGSMRSGRCYPRPELERPTSEKEFSLLPTPRANMGGGETSGRRLRPSGHKGTTNLTGWVKMWPTIRSSDAERGGRGDLIQAVRGNPNSHYKMWPTPRASENENRQTKPTPSQMNGTHGKSLAAEVGGQLNPTWVEWLMGFPLGHTALNALETPSSRKSRKRSAK